MAELFYNADRFLHDFEHPHDARGKIALLDNVKPYLEKKEILYVQSQSLHKSIISRR
ncbi:MAG: hypothetical protein HWD61_01345 [Parachlamydiaceae bacterium]|nr:MAG: hypothetical protein HWD61_01345 [Parachlamydiaceae bacterium]